MSGAPRPEEPRRRQREARAAAAAAGKARGVATGVGTAWRNLTTDQRLAAIAALALLLSMLLPWYQETGNALVDNRLVRLSDSKNAFQVYSFVEAAIFVVSAGVVALLHARGHRKAFQLPGGDGTVIMAAGLWVMFLIFYRQLDRPNGRSEGPINTSVGVEWGIFIAFLLGALLAYAGYRIRAAHTAEPALGGRGPQDRPPGPSRRARPEAASAAPERRPDEHEIETAVPAPRRAAEDDTTVADHRRPRRDRSEDETTVAGRRPRDPSEDDTTVPGRRAPRDPGDPLEGQLSFDEPAEYRPPPRRS